MQFLYASIFFHIFVDVGNNVRVQRVWYVMNHVLIKCLVLIITLYESCAYVSRNMAFLCFCVCVS